MPVRMPPGRLPFSGRGESDARSEGTHCSYRKVRRAPHDQGRRDGREVRSDLAENSKYGCPMVREVGPSRQMHTAYDGTRRPTVLAQAIVR